VVSCTRRPYPARLLYRPSRAHGAPAPSCRATRRSARPVHGVDRWGVGKGGKGGWQPSVEEAVLGHAARDHVERPAAASAAVTYSVVVYRCYGHHDHVHVYRRYPPPLPPQPSASRDRLFRAAGVPLGPLLAVAVARSAPRAIVSARSYAQCPHHRHTGRDTLAAAWAGRLHARGMRYVPVLCGMRLLATCSPPTPTTLARASRYVPVLCGMRWCAGRRRRAGAGALGLGQGRWGRATPGRRRAGPCAACCSLPLCRSRHSLCVGPGAGRALIAARRMARGPSLVQPAGNAARGCPRGGDRRLADSLSSRGQCAEGGGGEADRCVSI
jgi:hypothetical protein